MTQRDLDRQVARATGENISTIRNMGFSVLEMPEPEPRTVDWDELDESRLTVFPQHRQRQYAAAA